MESNKIFQKWLPLILLGCLGMFLSEFLIWNPMLQIITRHIPLTTLAIARTIMMTTFMYVALFAMGADIIQRFRIKDAVSLLILGSIYGLILEGIFASKVFDQVGFGPKISGILLVHLSFTALSWHPIIDFFIGFFILKWLFKGKINLGASRILPREFITAAVFGISWFIWPYAKWYAKLPLSLPILALEGVQLLFPMALIGMIFYLVFKRKTDYVPQKILGPIAYLIFIGYGLFFTARRFMFLPNKTAFLFFCTIILFYIILLALYLKFGRTKPATSIYEESFPITAEFSVSKYIKLCTFLLLLYFIFKYASAFLHLQGIYLILTMLLAGLMVLTGAIVPLYTIFKIIYGLLSGHAQQAKSGL